MKTSLGLCVVIVIVGISGVATDGGQYHGMPVGIWAYRGIAVVGFLGCIWHLWAIKTEKGKPKEPEAPLDEQYAQAKAELDRMYFREHGKMPEWPGEDGDEEDQQTK